VVLVPILGPTLLLAPQHLIVHWGRIFDVYVDFAVLGSTLHVLSGTRPLDKRTQDMLFSSTNGRPKQESGGYLIIVSTKTYRDPKAWGVKTNQANFRPNILWGRVVRDMFHLQPEENSPTGKS
jgi:hypothetical protein